MDWRAANEQQGEARWRVFLMFVVMAVLAIQTGLVSRGVIAVVSTQNARHDAASRFDPETPAELHQAILVLLCLAEAAGRSLIVIARDVWDLMNQPLSRPVQGLSVNADSLCERLAQRLDTS